MAKRSKRGRAAAVHTREALRQQESERQCGRLKAWFTRLEDQAIGVLRQHGLLNLPLQETRPAMTIEGRLTGYPVGDDYQKLKPPEREQLGIALGILDAINELPEITAENVKMAILCVELGMKSQTVWYCLSKDAIGRDTMFPFRSADGRRAVYGDERKKTARILKLERQYRAEHPKVSKEQMARKISKQLIKETADETGVNLADVKGCSYSMVIKKLTPRRQKPPQ